MDMRIGQHIEKPIKRMIQRIVRIPVKDIILTKPPVPEFGDIAFPCFELAKKEKISPVEIAKQLASKLKPNRFVERIQAAGPYVNFFLNQAQLATIVVQQILKEGQAYGKSKRKKEKIMVEFSQPNTHKAFHIGHLRNTCLGDSVVRILRFNGFDVVSANYINDTGAHVAKCLWLYLKKYKGKEAKSKNLGEWLGKIYAEAARAVEKDPKLKAEIDKIHRAIEAGDPLIIKEWQKTRKWSIDEFKKIYRELGVKFDTWFFDNELAEPGKKIVRQLLKKGIAEISEGAAIVDLKKYNLGVALILKSDGTTLYLTKDLALATERFKRFKISRMVYVVGSEQALHFKQLFKILQLMGFKQAKRCHHLKYELVMLKEGKMSSRAGNVVLYSYLASRTREKLKREISKRHPEWSPEKIEKVVNILALGAMKFAMLKYESNRVVIFDIKKALDFEGETGPYVQYAHARICSIFKKYGKRPPRKANLKMLTSKFEKPLLLCLSEFPGIIEQAALLYRPDLVARYLLNLAKRFNEFYHACPILQESKELRNARLQLIAAVRIVLALGLELLGIKAPQAM